MAGNDVFLYSVPSDANKNDVRLRDPTTAGTPTNGNATGALTSITLTAPNGSASSASDGSASGALTTVTLSAPAGSAAGTTNGTGTGAATTVTLTAPAATASGTATATGSVPGVTLTAPTGSASAGTSGTASGGLTTVSLSAPSGSAAGTSDGLANASGTSVTLSAPTGSASGTTGVADGSAAGSVPSITLTAPEGTASTGTVGGGGYDDTPKKKRYFVERDGKLLVFSTPTAAIEQVQDKPEPVKANGVGKKRPIKVNLPPPDEPEEVIDLGAVQEYARNAGLIEQYNAAYNSARYEALIALFEQMRDEEEVEMLLMAL